MTWRLLLVVGALAGCATTPTPNPWVDIETDKEPAAQPLELGEWPDPIGFSDDTLVFDLEGARALQAYQVAAEANTEIASELSEQVNDLNDATSSLVEAGKAQRVVADLRLEILEEERKNWFWEKTMYWAGFAIIAIAVAL